MKFSKYSYLISYFIFTFMVWLVYAQCIHFEYVLDDSLFIDKINDKVHSLPDLFKLFNDLYNNNDYRPITMLSFGLEYLFFGKLNPYISHIINVLLFISIAILIKKIISKLLPLLLDWEVTIIVCLFIAHPLCTEVVANVKSRDTLLSTFFSLLSIYQIIKYSYSKRIIFLITSAFFFFIATLCKLDSIGTLVFNIIVYYAINSRNNKFEIKAYLRIFVVLFLPIFLFRVILLPIIVNANINTNSSLGLVSITENPLIENFNIINRISALFQSIYFYVLQIIAPIHLRFYYGFKYYVLQPAFNLKTLLITLCILAVYVSIFWHYFKTKQQAYLLGLMGFSAYILYALNFFDPVAGVIADRYVFLGLPWFILLFFVLTKNLFIRFISIKKIYAFQILLILLLVFMSRNRCAAWQSEEILMDTDSPHLFESYEGMRIAANIYMELSDSTEDTIEKKNYLNKAITCAHNANKVFPKNSLMFMYEGQYLFANGDTEKAIDCFVTAHNNDSTNYKPLLYLGDIYYTKKDYNSALKYYSQSFSKNDSSHILINNIGTVLFESGEKLQSKSFSEDIIKKDSTQYAAWENLGYYYLAEKDTNEAKKHFKEAVKYGLSPNLIPQFMD